VRNRKILSVDDDADVASTFRMILEMNGFEVDSYTSPISALFNKTIRSECLYVT
jgi:FixJ family two-component response regulator